MSKAPRIGLIVGSVVALLILAGCQNGSSPSSSSMPTPAKAIVITGNGGSTVVWVPTADPDQPMMLSTSGSTEVCPECKAAAIKYFKTGVLDPKCSRTGATRTELTVVPQNLGHN